MLPVVPVNSRDTAVVLVAGGTGERFGRTGGKQLAGLAGTPVMAHAFAVSASVERVGCIVVVCHPERIEEYAAAVTGLGPEIAVGFVAGGVRRQDSVRAGLSEVPGTFGYIAVHDAARPLATPELFVETLELLDGRPELAGAVVGHPSVDTIKTVEDGIVTGTPDRALLWAVQTPQVFRSGAVRAAYAEAERSGLEGTDDASLVEAAGGTIAVVEGPRENIKVTHAGDIAVAEALLLAREGRRA